MRNLAKKIQTRIESLYDTKLIKNIGNSITNKTKHVEDFIGKDKKTKSMIYENKEYGFTCCKVLGNKLESLVYIHPKAIKNLKENNPFKSLNEKNILSFLVLAEEIDHWEYLNTKFELQKTPNNFELELQAAVTKYWLSIRSMAENKNELTKKDISFLMLNVFPQCDLNLDKNKIDINDIIKREEYHVADLLARDYCKYLTGKSIDLILFSLRKFYRMDEEEKVCYVMKDFETNPIL